MTTLTLTRTWVTPKSIISGLIVPGLDKQLFTLERPGVEIPEGAYTVKMQFSTRFNRDLPTLQNVPGRSHILIHVGNFPKDTEGCLLVGTDRGQNSVLNSKVALTKLLDSVTFPCQLTISHFA